MTGVSVVLPAYNAASFISETLESVMAQTYPDFELVVINDGSTDSTWEIIQKYAPRDARIRAFTQEKIGQSLTLNRAIEAAQRELVLIFDADDVMLPDCVAAQARFMRERTELVGAGCLARFINERGREFWNEKNPFLTLADYQRAYEHGDALYFRHPGFIFKRSEALAIGGYRVIPQANDIDFFNRLADRGPLLTNPQVLLKYRVHSGQDSMKYEQILHPRLTWAWVRACNHARRAGKLEPGREEFIHGFSGWDWRERLSFWMYAMGRHYSQKARVSYISGRPSFIINALLALALSPLPFIQRLLARLSAGKNRLRF